LAVVGERYHAFFFQSTNFSLAQLCAVILVREIYVDFDWHPGFSATQREKSIRSLHQSAKKVGINPVLEISTKSPLSLGKDLSAFNLQFKQGTLVMCVEAVFQGSKVFRNGGPFTDIYNLGGRDAKRDKRLRNSWQLLGFALFGEKWPLEPKTAFYDWIYINALHQVPELRYQVTQFEGFSDIEFNPEKSFNCQARSVALYVALIKLNLLQVALSNKENYLQIISPGFNKDDFGQSLLSGL
jgi:hypothetical protein